MKFFRKFALNSHRSAHCHFRQGAPLFHGCCVFFSSFFIPGGVSCIVPSLISPLLSIVNGICPALLTGHAVVILSFPETCRTTAVIMDILRLSGFVFSSIPTFNWMHSVICFVVFYGLIKAIARFCENFDFSSSKSTNLSSFSSQISSRLGHFRTNFCSSRAFECRHSTNLRQHCA